MGKKLIKKYESTTISNYYVNDFTSYIGISKKQFYKTVEKFRNKKIWKKINGKWKINYKW